MLYDYKRVNEIHCDEAKELHELFHSLITRISKLVIHASNSEMDAVPCEALLKICGEHNHKLKLITEDVVRKIWSDVHEFTNKNPN